MPILTMKYKSARAATMVRDLKPTIVTLSVGQAIYPRSPQRPAGLYGCFAATVPFLSTIHETAVSLAVLLGKRKETKTASPLK